MKITPQTKSISFSENGQATRTPNARLQMKVNMTPEVALAAALAPPVADTGTAPSASTQSTGTESAPVGNSPSPTAAAPAPAPTQPAEQTVLDSSGTAEKPAEATQPLSPQFAALARQRRALQRERREFEAQRQAQTAQDDGSSKVELARLKSEPLRVLQEAGVSYDQLTEAILNGKDTAEIDALRAQMAEIKQEFDTKLTERDQQTRQQVLAQMQYDGEREVGQGDQFELIQASGNAKQYVRDAVKVVERIYDQTGDVIDMGEALQMVENELYEDSLKWARSKKVQAALAPKPEPVVKPAEPAPTTQPQQQRPMTLTNRDTANPLLSRKSRAMAAFYGQLK